MDAHAKAQDLRRSSNFSAARDQLRQCSSAPSCPALIRDDCTKRLDELEGAQPTLVFEVKDAAGNDLSAVKVTIDGALLTERLGGTALSVDPGEHTFTFEAGGLTPLTRKLIIREAQKDRRESITLAALVARRPGASQLPEVQAQPPPPPLASAKPGLGAQKSVAIVAGGVGVVGIVLGSAFGALALSKKSEAESACPGTPCRTQAGANEWSDAASTGNISTAAFIVGGVAAAGGLLLWLTAKPSEGAPSAQVGFGAGTLLVRGEW